jgi:hypothetical protein
MFNERYCPSLKPRWEHDKECYYHGELNICPYCGTKTLPVIEGTYVPIKGYTVRELGG